MAIIGTFAVFIPLGFTINTLTMFGFVLAIGIVVDDAIVVVEAVQHNIDAGMTPKDATKHAMQDISGPVVAIALILAAVFVPVGFIPGIVGRLYQQFAITIAISVIFSMGLDGVSMMIRRVFFLMAFSIAPASDISTSV